VPCLARAVGARWKVSWIDAAVWRATTPLRRRRRRRQRGELVVRAIDAPTSTSKRVWCFDVGGGLLVVRRAQRVSAARFHAGECEPAADRVCRPAPSG
jgi:hypothetical protein